MLVAAGITVPNEVVNDCDPSDKEYITNATALQRKGIMSYQMGHSVDLAFSGNICLCGTSLCSQELQCLCMQMKTPFGEIFSDQW